MNTDDARNQRQLSHTSKPRLGARALTSLALGLILVAVATVLEQRSGAAARISWVVMLMASTYLLFGRFVRQGQQQGLSRQRLALTALVGAGLTISVAVLGMILLRG